MKTGINLLAIIVTLGASAWMANAQDGGGAPPPPGGPGGPPQPGMGRPPPPLPPIILALDTNRDGVIDEQEIANASAALKSLDKNGEGKLTVEMLLAPPRRGNNSGPTGPPDGKRPHRRPVPPIIVALDTNHDGVIDEQEIANASAALKSLDKRGDGKLTLDELLGPPPPPRDRDSQHGGPPDNQEPPGPPPPEGGGDS